MPRRSSPRALPVPPDFLVLGLGNPGRPYRSTRHNLGFRVAEALAEASGARWQDAPGPALAAAIEIGPRSGVVAKPLTWMNRSGLAARALRERLEGPDLSRLLLVTDDLDLPLGRLRLRKEGGAGGHNGLRSVVVELGSGAFPRLRLGIGRPPADDALDVVDHVLESFLPEEEPAVADLVERACRAVELFVAEGVESAMNRFNAG
jgi:PTH1 family peptidyl-tRNA hydrolase